MAAGAGAMFAGLMLGPIVRYSPELSDAVRSLLWPAAAVLATLSAAWCMDHLWKRRARRFAHAIRRARLGTSGAAAVELAAGDSAALRIVAREVRMLTMEVKRERRESRRLRSEAARQVARRTGQLEREINVLRKKAARDSLTGLNNRTAFDELFPQMVRSAVRSEIDLSVVMIDVDDFKGLNDTLGHLAGDSLLRDIGRLIRTAIRDCDAAFRYGGDEFVIILPQATAEVARKIAHRLSRLVDELTRTLSVAHPPGLSCGVASIRQERQVDPDALLAAADADCYRAKQAHKSRRAA